tara:strand:- start:371 stop:1174 length:804 start_codon:yes stop_codon:yes gene_type:complete
MVTDSAGNTVSCNFNVTVTDNEKPIITCPNKIMICDTIVTVPLPIFSDNCFVGLVTNDFNLSNNASGIYPYGVTTVNWTVSDSSGNTNSCLMTIEVEITPTSTAGEDQVVIGLSNTKLNAANVIVGVGSWVSVIGYGNVLDDSDPFSNVDQLETGENIFEWNVANGTCPVAIDEVMITVLPLVVPNGFSPNNDGDNDLLVIAGIDLLANEITIFNRWGVELFHTIDYQNDWDGRSKLGKDLPGDTYFYLIKVPELDKELNGFIVLRR